MSLKQNLLVDKGAETTSNPQASLFRSVTSIVSKIKARLHLSTYVAQVPLIYSFNQSSFLSNCSELLWLRVYLVCQFLVSEWTIYEERPCSERFCPSQITRPSPLQSEFLALVNTKAPSCTTFPHTSPLVVGGLPGENFFVGGTCFDS
jgi:hypothetical protein